MPDRMLVTERQQVGIELTPGTAAVPTINLQALSIDIDTNLEFDEFGPMGQLPQSIVAPRQEWSAGSLSGYPTYTELPYALSNALGAAVITTPSGATLARQWLWEPSASTPWVPKTWTLRRGVPGDTAEEANYLLMSGLNLHFSRTAAAEVGGDLFAQRLNYAATLAATGVTSRANVPILPTQIDVFLDQTNVYGTTQLLRDFDYTWSVSGLFDMIWPLNSALPSFAAHSVLKPTIECTLQTGNDAEGRALVQNMRAGSTVYARLRARGAADSIESGQRYSLQIDTPLKVVGAPTRADLNGLSTLQWTFRNVYDATLAKWLSIAMTVDFAAL